MRPGILSHGEGPVPAPEPAPVDVEAIRARLADATAGPWRRFETMMADTFIVGPRGFLNGDLITGATYEKANAEFIAHARTDIENLLDENAVLRESLEIFVALQDSARQKLEAFADRLDEHVYQELDSDLSDEARDRFGEHYRTRLADREAVIESVRRAHAPMTLYVAVPGGAPASEGRAHLVCPVCRVDAPCPTLRLIDGDA